MKKYLTTFFIFLVLCMFTASCYSDEASEWYSKGVSYYDNGLYGKAIECFNESIRLNPNNPNAYYGRGQAYFDTYSLEEAISDFTKVIKSVPNFSGAYFLRGKSYNELKDFESAISDYSKAIELDPENAEYYLNRGMLYRNNSEIYGLDEAEKDYRKACELGDNYACNRLRSFY